MLPQTEVARLAGLSLQAFGGMPQDWDGETLWKSYLTLENPPGFHNEEIQVLGVVVVVFLSHCISLNKCSETHVVATPHSQHLSHRAYFKRSSTVENRLKAQGWVRK